MSDVKILAPLSARGTGIPRTSTQVPRRDPTGAANSHVSASPSAGARAQAQVAAVRRPPARGQEATVVMLDRPAARSAPAAAPAAVAGPSVTVSQSPTVQIVERPGAPVATAAFTVEHMMLMGFLLDRYRENLLVLNDPANTATIAIAEDALAVLGVQLQAAGAPGAPTPAPAPVSTGRVDAADGPDTGTRGRAGTRGRGRRADARAGDAAASIDAPGASSSSAAATSGDASIASRVPAAAASVEAPSASSSPASSADGRETA